MVYVNINLLYQSLLYAVPLDDEILIILERGLVAREITQISINRTEQQRQGGQPLLSIDNFIDEFGCWRIFLCIMNANYRPHVMPGVVVVDIFQQLAPVVFSPHILALKSGNLIMPLVPFDGD